jgi:hypothetical protein
MMVSKMNCHTGNPLVFEAEGIKVYAGGTSRQGAWTRMNPYPDVAIGPVDVMPMKIKRDVLPDGWSCTDKIDTGKIPHIIGIDWPDFSIPANLGKDFWIALVDDFKTKNVKTVSTSCMGGHGRTGVQLAILAHLMIPTKDQTWKDVAELVNYIRDSYCTHAVENFAQQQYIADMIDIPVGDTLFIQSNNKITWDDVSMQSIYDELAETDKKKGKKGKKGKSRKRERKAIDGVEFKKGGKQSTLGAYINQSKPKDDFIQRGYVLCDMLEAHDEYNRFIWFENKMYHENVESLEEIFGVLSPVHDINDYKKEGLCISCGQEYTILEMHHNECKYCIAKDLGIKLDYEKQKILGKSAAFIDVVEEGGSITMKSLSDTDYFEEQWEMIGPYLKNSGEKKGSEKEWKMIK